MTPRSVNNVVSIASTPWPNRNPRMALSGPSLAPHYEGRQWSVPNKYRPRSIRCSIIGTFYVHPPKWVRDMYPSGSISRTQMGHFRNTLMGVSLLRINRGTQDVPVTVPTAEHPEDSRWYILGTEAVPQASHSAYRGRADHRWCRATLASGRQPASPSTGSRAAFSSRGRGTWWRVPRGPVAPTKRERSQAGRPERSDGRDVANRSRPATRQDPSCLSDGGLSGECSVAEERPDPGGLLGCLGLCLLLLEPVALGHQIDDRRHQQRSALGLIAVAEYSRLTGPPDLAFGGR